MGTLQEELDVKKMGTVLENLSDIPIIEMEEWCRHMDIREALMQDKNWVIIVVIWSKELGKCLSRIQLWSEKKRHRAKS